MTCYIYSRGRDASGNAESVCSCGQLFLAGSFPLVDVAVIAHLEVKP